MGRQLKDVQLRKDEPGYNFLLEVTKENPDTIQGIVLANRYLQHNIVSVDTNIAEPESSVITFMGDVPKNEILETLSLLRSLTNSKLEISWLNSDRRIFQSQTFILYKLTKLGTHNYYKESAMYITAEYRAKLLEG